MTDSWQQVFNQWPFLAIAWDALWIIVPLGCMLAYAGMFFLASTAKILATSRNRASFDKCARQLSGIGLILGWLLLICGRIWLYYTQDIHIKGSLGNFILEIDWMLLSLGVLLSSIFYTLWRVLKNMPILHITLGMISAVQNCLALGSIIFTCRFMEAVALPGSPDSIYDLFPFDWKAPVWSAACQTLPLMIALAAAFGAVWLALRRKADNFGRDYYNLMLCWCSTWARNAWTILWLMILAATATDLWAAYGQGSFNEQNALVESGRLLFWLLPALLWALFCKSKIPLRQRWALYIALPIALGFALPYYLELTFL